MNSRSWLARVYGAASAPVPIPSPEPPPPSADDYLLDDDGSFATATGATGAPARPSGNSLFSPEVEAGDTHELRTTFADWAEEGEAGRGHILAAGVSRFAVGFRIEDLPLGGTNQSGERLQAYAGVALVNESLGAVKGLLFGRDSLTSATNVVVPGVGDSGIPLASLYTMRFALYIDFISNGGNGSVRIYAEGLGLVAEIGANLSGWTAGQRIIPDARMLVLVNADAPDVSGVVELTALLRASELTGLDLPAGTTDILGVVI